jgi:rhodanese-related sulfurtransferase
LIGGTGGWVYNGLEIKNTQLGKDIVMSKKIKSKSQLHKSQPRKQKKYIWLWGIVIAFVIGMIAWQNSSSSTSKEYPLEISLEEAAAKRESGVFILDVRQPEEWNEYHVPGSTLIPLGELASRVDELPLDQEIVVVCRSGNRSAQGRDILIEAGFTQVTSLAGGLSQWQAAGYPVVSGP